MHLSSATGLPWQLGDQSQPGVLPPQRRCSPLPGRSQMLSVSKVSSTLFALKKEHTLIHPYQMHQPAGTPKSQMSFFVAQFSLHHHVPVIRCGGLIRLLSGDKFVTWRKSHKCSTQNLNRYKRNSHTSLWEQACVTSPTRSSEMHIPAKVNFLLLEESEAVYCSLQDQHFSNQPVGPHPWNLFC